LARRIVISASEDVGLANPTALQTAVAAADAVKTIGMPEGRIILAQAAILVAVSPKSNASYAAINKALSDVKDKNLGEIPMHIRNANYKGMKDLGYGVGYKYAHDYEGNYVKQNYFPEDMIGTIYYNPTKNGFEERINGWLERIRD
jgi:putative ATPase